MHFPSKTLGPSPLRDAPFKVGMTDGSAVEAPTRPLFSFDLIGSSGPARKISGSGSMYGRSLMRWPSFRQSSNLYRVNSSHRAI